MQSWWSSILRHPGPKYLAIADAIGEAIRTGGLRAGERLPPQRALAATLGVDLTTISRGYGLARDAGLIEGAGRLGSYVRNSADLPVQDIAADKGMIVPPQPPSALLPEALRSGMMSLLRAGGQSPLLQYQPSGGSLRDRREAASAFVRRGIAASEDDVVITAGGQNALHAILGTVLQPGDMICAGRSTYPGLLALAARFGLRLRGLDADAEGVDCDALETAARAGAKALYVVPTNDNPTTATMSLERRRAIAAVARRHGLLILEDDAYGQLPLAPLPPLAALAPECTWHIASVSKIISPTLRVAHVKAPSPRASWQLAADIYETAVMAPPLNAALVSLWLRDGMFAALVSAVRHEGIVRQRIVARFLHRMTAVAHPEGYHIWLRLAPGTTAAELAAKVKPLGLSIVPGDAFAIDKAAAEPACRISIGGTIDHEQLARAFERLESLIDHRTPRRAPVI